MPGRQSTNWRASRFRTLGDDDNSRERSGRGDTVARAAIGSARVRLRFAGTTRSRCTSTAWSGASRTASASTSIRSGAKNRSCAELGQARRATPCLSARYSRDDSQRAQLGVDSTCLGMPRGCGVSPASDGAWPSGGQLDDGAPPCAGGPERSWPGCQSRASRRASSPGQSSRRVSAVMSW